MLQFLITSVLRMRILIAASLLLMLFLSCSRQRQGETDLVTFPLRGEVVAIDTAASTVTVAHEAIPNYMNAMVMPFKVKSKALLSPLAIGDSITATLAVSRTESWLETIAVRNHGESPRTLSANDIITAKIFTTGDPFPDETLLNQESATVRFSKFRGKVLAITFIYTRCPLPDFCIRMSNHFARVQKALKEDPALAGRWHLMSISFDPHFDRPARLKRYAAGYGADFSTWDFTTDPDTAGTTIQRIADGLGLTYANDEGLIAHNLRTVLIDPGGRLARVINGNEWTPEELVSGIRSLARN
jgi:protein SCO1/2